MSKKITATLDGVIMGKEFTPAKEAMKFTDKKTNSLVEIDAKPDTYSIYVALGNADKDGFFNTQPTVLSVSVPKADYEKTTGKKMIKCTCDFENEKYTITSIDGITVIPKNKAA